MPSSPTPDNGAPAPSAGYFIRCFCATGEPPTLAELIQWLADREVHVTATGTALTARDWRQAALTYKAGNKPIVAEIRPAETPDTPGRREIESFLAAVGAPGKSHVKRRVVKHLQGTRFIVALRIPKDDIDDAGYDANGQILTYFCENNGALIQADGEGFYERSTLVLPLP